MHHLFLIGFSILCSFKVVYTSESGLNQGPWESWNLMDTIWTLKGRENFEMFDTNATSSDILSNSMTIETQAAHTWSVISLFDDSRCTKLPQRQVGISSSTCYAYNGLSFRYTCDSRSLNMEYYSSPNCTSNGVRNTLSLLSVGCNSTEYYSVECHTTTSLPIYNNAQYTVIENFHHGSRCNNSPIEYYTIRNNICVDLTNRRLNPNITEINTSTNTASILINYPLLSEYSKSSTCSGVNYSHQLPTNCSSTNATWNPSILGGNKDDKNKETKLVIKPHKTYVYENRNTQRPTPVPTMAPSPNTQTNSKQKPQPSYSPSFFYPTVPSTKIIPEALYFTITVNLYGFDYASYSSEVTVRRLTEKDREGRVSRSLKETSQHKMDQTIFLMTLKNIWGASIKVSYLKFINIFVYSNRRLDSSLDALATPDLKRVDMTVQIDIPNTYILGFDTAKQAYMNLTSRLQLSLNTTVKKQEDEYSIQWIDGITSPEEDRLTMNQFRRLQSSTVFSSTLQQAASFGGSNTYKYVSVSPILQVSDPQYGPPRSEYSTPTTNSNSNTPTEDEVIGLTVGLILGVLLIALIIFMIYRYRTNKANEEISEGIQDANKVDVNKVSRPTSPTTKTLQRVNPPLIPVVVNMSPVPGGSARSPTLNGTNLMLVNGGVVSGHVSGVNSLNNSTKSMRVPNSFEPNQPSPPSLERPDADAPRSWKSSYSREVTASGVATPSSVKSQYRE